MYRVLPQRWWLVALLAPVGLMIGVVASARLGGFAALGDSGDPGILWSALIGTGVAVVVAAATTLLSVRSDSRHLALSDQFPGAIVVKAWASGPAAMFDVEPWREGPPPPAGFSVVFDMEGIRFFAGGPVPELSVRIPWAAVKDVVSGPVLTFGVPTARVSMATVRLAVEGGDRANEIQFGVERLSGLSGFKSMYLDEAEIAELAARVRSLRADGDREPQPSQSVSKALEPGLTAWSIGRFVGTPLVVVSSLLLVAPPLLIAATRSFHLLGFAAALALVIVATYLSVLLVDRRANQREAAAGYTTLNRIHLDREQRHPRSGRILRQAGGQPLTKAEFRHALALGA